jgi:hypothetical protein
MEKLTVKNFVPVALSYGAVVGALYLFSYWGSFNVNVLEFIGLTGLLKLALYPLLVSIAFFFFGYGLAEFMSRDLPSGGAANTPIGRAVNSNLRLLALLNLSAILAILVQIETPERWLCAALLTGFFNIALVGLPFFVELIPNYHARYSVLYLAIVVAGLAIYVGTYRAYDAKLGRSQVVVDVARSNLKLQTSVGRPVAYLGFLGGYFVLLESSSGTVAMIKLKDDTAIFLMPNVSGRSK